MEKEITVVIATLREDTPFQATLDSCLAQANVDLEVVVFVHDTKYEMASPWCRCIQSKGKLVVMLKGNDDGIADAWNASVDRAAGRYLVFLGSGDIFFSSHSVRRLLDLALESNVPGDNVLIGNQFIRKADGRLQKWKTRLDESNHGLEHGMTIPHASSLWPRKLWEHDKFDRSFKIALDYEYALRVKDKTKFSAFPCPVSIIEPGGLSNAPSRMLEVIKEDVRARQNNRLPPNYLSIINIKRLLRWIKAKLT